MKKYILFLIFLLIVGISCGNRLYQQPRTEDHKKAVEIMYNDIYPVLKNKSSFEIISTAEGQMKKNFGWSKLVKLKSSSSYENTKQELTNITEGYFNKKLSYSQNNDIHKDFDITSESKHIRFGLYDKDNNYWYISFESD
jgi:lipoprotein